MTRLLIILLLLPGCAGWTINGIPADRFRHMEPKEYAQVLAGAGGSFFTHWALGHVAYLEAEGIEWHQDGLTERFNTNGLPSHKIAMVGRSGFLMQLLVGTGLKHSPWKDSWFVTGYHIGTAAEIIAYPVMGFGDFETIRQGGGNSDLEYALYSVWSLWNLDLRKE